MNTSATAMPGFGMRMALMSAGIVLGVALVAGHGLLHARPHEDRARPLPAASVPAGSYVAPGSQG